jgi:hypothetical protein
LLHRIPNNLDEGKSNNNRKNGFPKVPYCPHHHPPKLMIQSKKNGKLGTRHDEGEQKI